MIDLSKLHSMVWKFRRETQDAFPVPNREDSLRFAFTEAGEAMDAHLRTNGDYKRNRDKAHSVEREMAQTLMMLMTAWGDKPFVGMCIVEPTTIDEVVWRVAIALFTRNMHDAAFAAVKICRYVGPSIETELADALDALRAKHINREEVAPCC